MGNTVLFTWPTTGFDFSHIFSTKSYVCFRDHPYVRKLIQFIFKTSWFMYFHENSCSIVVLYCTVRFCYLIGRGRFGQFSDLEFLKRVPPRILLFVAKLEKFQTRFLNGLEHEPTDNIFYSKANHVTSIKN